MTIRADGANAGELMGLDNSEADAGIILDLLLKFIGKLLVAFGGDHGQRVHLKSAQAIAVLIHAQAQTAADGLAALLFRCHVAQDANLEDVGIVPALAQGGV